ncbi:MAG TPA: signal peptidase I [Polyangiaceae bacterium]|nr:signal peptidase I [Polyangiaceae bacterium]
MELRRILRRLLAALWLAALPALLTANVYQHLLSRTPGSFFGSAAFEGEARVLATALLFLLFAAVAWYWRGLVPGLVPRAGRPWLVTGGLAVLVLGWVGGKVVYQPYRVQSSSMLPVMKTNDELLVGKARYDRQRLPRRGDLVRFAVPTGVATDEAIRRVIGLPGDHIEMKKGGFPIINGWAVPTCDVGRYFRWGSQGETNARLLLEFLDDAAYLTVHINRATAFAPFVVPDGEVFVLADNRNATADSRNWKDDQPAGLPLAAIDGRVELILLSKNQAQRVDTSVTLHRPGLFFNLHGQNLSDLHDKLSECLRERPSETSPPGPGSAIPGPSTAARLGP